MKDIELVTLDNGQDYMIVDEIDNYVYLVNFKNSNDFCVRKTSIENGEEYMEGVDSNEEYDKALLLFAQKHKEENVGK